LNKIWDEGDAVLPIDQRLPQTAKQQLVKDLGASWIIANDGEKTKLENGFQVEANDALVIATSGTTGVPKGVVHTHTSIHASVTAAGSRLGCSSNDHWFACLPLAHVGGLSVLLRAQQFKSGLTIVDGVDQTSIDSAINTGANLTSLVPTTLQKFDVSKFRAVLVGGSSTLGNLPANAITTYGLTETMGGIAYDDQALDGVAIRVSDSAEIEIQGEVLFRTYRDGTDPKKEDGWFTTGDLGEIRDGVLTVHGRKDDLIITGGYKVWPKLVESSISQIDGVIDCVVMGLPDAKWGQTVCTWIVLKNLDLPLNLEDVRRHVKTSLPDYCAPHKLFIVESIPRSALGKVLSAEISKIKGRLYE
jgi:O-succinylbenzoic acid--CoA ligase